MASPIKKRIVIFLAILAMLGIGLACGQEEEGELKTFRGQVQEIDWVGSLMTVAGYDDVTFYVPPGTKIIYGTETVSLDDIEQDDNVTVVYEPNITGTPRAVKITVDKSFPIF